MFCNFDGKNKHRTTVGEKAFIGANSTIVSPVNIAIKSKVAAGSTITKDTCEGDLAVSRIPQTNIKNKSKID